MICAHCGAAVQEFKGDGVWRDESGFSTCRQVSAVTASTQFHQIVF